LAAIYNNEQLFGQRPPPSFSGFRENQGKFGIQDTPEEGATSGRALLA
jgi:hypothetical protein